MNRGPELTSQNYLVALSQAKKHAQKKQILFDLTKLKFWDTRGIESVISTIIEINKIHPMRAGIFSPKKDNMNFVVATRMYNVELTNRQVPWYDSEEELLRAMQN